MIDAVALPADLAPPEADPPFEIVRLPTGELRRLCEIDDGDPVRHPHASRRAVFARRGHLLLADVMGEEAVQIGPRVTFADAGELATAVLGAVRSGAAPLCLHTLALAYLAALAEVERLRHVVRSAPAGSAP